MPRVWDADVTLSPEDAARLVERQCPALAPVRLEPLGAGWDNSAYTVNGHWVFRFPRRRIARALLENEVRLLPRLAPLLPVSIPVPVWVGQPEGDYPYPFAGYARLPGTTACAVAWSEAERARTAPVLGGFLAALHGVPVTDEDVARGPGDTMGRADLPRRAPLLLERLAELDGVLPESEVAAVREMVARRVDTPAWAQRPCWVHGDLYPRHLLVDAAHRVTGVLDWGDVHLGDPAVDLMLAWTFLPPEARPAFREAYGPIDADTWARAHFRALFYGVTLLGYGRSTGDDAIAEVGRVALRYGLQEECC